jgi:hypothetical protein
MHKHPLFISWALLLVVVASLHILALEFFLYWLYPLFDVFMHFLGGVFIGLSSLWLFFESGYIKLNKSSKNVIIVVGVSIFFVGIGWEIFEIFAGIPIEENFKLDTAVDLIMDVLGAFIAYFIFIRVYLSKYLEELNEQERK